MSNQVYIQRTEFTNYGTNDKLYGFRIYDDYDQDYCNSFTQDELKLSSKDFLEIVKENLSERGNEMFDFGLENDSLYLDDERIQK